MAPGSRLAFRVDPVVAGRACESHPLQGFIGQEADVTRRVARIIDGGGR